jgi:hypothetical protein
LIVVADAEVSGAICAAVAFVTPAIGAGVDVAWPTWPRAVLRVSCQPPRFDAFLNASVWFEEAGATKSLPLFPISPCTLAIYC